MNQLKEIFPDIQWEKNIDLSARKDNADASEPIKIAHNVYLYLSYQDGAFKTAEENTQLQITTPSLIRKLVGDLKVDVSQIQVISQYSKDLEEARKLQIQEENIFSANDYFPVQEKGLEHTQ